jgi:glutamyl/glutaminyl-tRNA synthetase
VSYQDLVFGEIKYQTADIGDFIIVRSDKSILYNFSNVVDDHEMGITHVVRGQGHLSNTPRQLLIYQTLGFIPPEFAHLPDVLNPDRVGKLSKRYGAAAVTEFRDRGYLPEAIINFLGSLSWSHPQGQEFFDLGDMVEHFSFDRVGKAPPALDVEKLDHFNAHYLRQKSLLGPIGEALGIKDEAVLRKLEPLIKERITKIGDIKVVAGYLTEEPAKPKFKYEHYNKVLSLAAQASEKIDPWTKEDIEKGLREAQGASGTAAKEFFVTIGQAVSGSDVFLPLFDSLEILGRDETLRRLKRS